MVYKKDKILLESIAYKLRTVRLEKSLTQEDVTFDTGINVGLIELGKTNISVTTLVTLCNYYGLTLEDFIRGIEYSRP